MNEPVENTPFRLIGQEGKGYFLSIANYQLTEAKATPEETMEEFHNKEWEIITNLIIIMNRIIKEVDGE